MKFKVVFFDIGQTLCTKTEWLPGAKELVVKLRTAGVRVGVLSNTGDWTRDQLQERLPGDFDFSHFDEDLVLLSSETGIPKPAIGAFLLAVQHGGHSPWETLFVGETIGETFAAQAAGMHAIRVTSPEEDYRQLGQLLL